jgi:hypothetical protein
MSEKSRCKSEDDEVLKALKAQGKKAKKMGRPRILAQRRVVDAYKPRPQSAADVRAEARAWAGAALETIKDIMSGHSIPARERLKACELILQYGVAKPIATVDDEGKKALSPLEELVQILQQTPLPPKDVDAYVKDKQLENSYIQGQLEELKETFELEVSEAANMDGSDGSEN